MNNSRQAWAALLPVESGSYSTVSCARPSLEEEDEMPET